VVLKIGCSPRILPDPIGQKDKIFDTIIVAFGQISIFKGPYGHEKFE
jgi:hypothetical protein